MSTSCLTLTARTPAGPVRLRSLPPRKMWLYSAPIDQFGAKPNSRPAPTVPPQRHAAERSVVLGADHSRAALDVEQHVVPGVTDLTGDQTERIDLGAVREAGDRADMAAGEVGPVALAFHAEHELAGLPAIADLATDRAAGRIVRTITAETDQVPLRARRTAAAVDTDVEAAPVVDRGDHRRRLGVGPRCEVSSQRRRSRAQRDKAHSGKQQILFHLSPVPVSSLGPLAVQWS